MAEADDSERKIKPPAVVMAWAKKIGMDFKEAYRRWKKAEELAQNRFKQPKITKRGVYAKSNPKYWMYVMGIFKTMMFQKPGQHAPASFTEGFLQAIVDYLLGKKKQPKGDQQEPEIRQSEPGPDLELTPYQQRKWDKWQKKNRTAFRNKQKMKSAAVDDSTISQWMKSISERISGDFSQVGGMFYIEMTEGPDLVAGVSDGKVHICAFSNTIEECDSPLVELSYHPSEIRSEFALFARLKAVALRGKQMEALKMRKLTPAAREKMPKGEFASPEDKSYPIPDAKHASLALVYTTWPKNAKDTEKVKEVQAAVQKKFPKVYAQWLARRQEKE